MSRTSRTVDKAMENDVIQNSKLEHLYNHDFGSGRFFQVVFSNENETHVKLAPRTLMKIVYIREKNDIEGIEIVKEILGAEKQRIKFSKFDFQQLKSFLSFINSIDLATINDRRIKLADNSLDILDEETKKKIGTLLSGSDGGDFVKDLLQDGLITNQDLVNTGYRKKQLEIYRKLLYEKEFMQEYKRDIGKITTKDETAWQHFFNENEWIFGYGLDYQFKGILQKEFRASDSDASGSDTVIGDFLIGDKRFTTFVELKLPTTSLFNKGKNRSGAWRLSNSLIDSVSQILEQKASGAIKIETTRDLYDEKGSLINQNSYDSKTILIIGNWNELERSEDSPQIKKIKKKTFELYRRDSRNIEIITYDELYERAKFIVG